MSAGKYRVPGDVRERIRAAWREGLKTSVIMERFGVSEGYVQRLTADLRMPGEQRR